MRSTVLTIALAWTILGSSAPEPCAAAPPLAERLADYERAGPEEIRADAREILEDSDFKEETPGWLDRIRQEVFRRVADIMGKLLGHGGVGAVIGWVLLGVFILAVLALIAHAVWLLVGQSSLARRSSAAGDVPHFARFTEHPHEWYVDEMRRLATEKRYREALAAMMAAMLRWLSDRRLVSYDESKTNGDYAREYPQRHPGRPEFGRFVLRFDETIYGGAACDAARFHQISEIFEQVRHNAQRPTQ